MGASNDTPSSASDFSRSAVLTRDATQSQKLVPLSLIVRAGEPDGNQMEPSTEMGKILVQLKASDAALPQPSQTDAESELGGRSGGVLSRWGSDLALAGRLASVYDYAGVGIFSKLG